MTEPDEAQLFREGLELFNGGEFFEAHETWEDLWHLCTGPRKVFIQGLIQCAVTLEHVRRGNPRGVQNVWKSAVEKFRASPEVYMGVHVPQLLGDLQRFIQPVLDLPRDMFDPGKGRGLELPVNLEQAPKITLRPDDSDAHGLS